MLLVQNFFNSDLKNCHTWYIPKQDFKWSYSSKSTSAFVSLYFIQCNFTPGFEDLLSSHHRMRRKTSSTTVLFHHHPRNTLFLGPFHAHDTTIKCLSKFTNSTTFLYFNYYPQMLKISP